MPQSPPSDVNMAKFGQQNATIAPKRSYFSFPSASHVFYLSNDTDYSIGNPVVEGYGLHHVA